MSACPICGEKGKIVDTATVKALLAVSLRRVQETTYRFCARAACDVVYYDDSGEQLFTTAEIRERVYQKEPDADDVLICYCFQHRTADVHADAETVIADIREGVKTGQCACDWRNPQGNCCLGNVRRLAASSTDHTG